MRILFICLLCVGFMPFSSFSQKTKFYVISPGENILDIVPKAEVYEYPQFQQGIVNFRSGRRSLAKLNYHYIYEEILFVGPDGDTLTISNPDDIRYVSIGSDEFYYSKDRYVKLDTVIGDIKLATSGFFATISKKRVGAYGTITDGGSDSYSSFIVPNTSKLELVANVITTVAKGKALFIGNTYNQFMVISKKDIFSFFPEKQTQLKKYLQDNEVNFYSRKDIVALIVYMSKL